MTKSDIFDLLLRCNGPQLDAITAKLDLNQAFLPSQGQAGATRASGILGLADQQDLLPKLEAALLAIFPPKPSSVTIAAGQRSILIFSANPVETARLKIEKEQRFIVDRLQETEQGRSFRVEKASAVRVTDISKLLLQHQPVIVHFSGHGSPTGDIVLEDENGRARPLSVNVLANLFEILQGPTECVVLNACYSTEKARALANYVGCVVGMDRSIGDESALNFAAGFYRGIAFGKDYYAAFRLGCNEIDLLSLPDATVPHFTTRQEDKVASFIVQGDTPQIALTSPIRTWVNADTEVISPDNPDIPRRYPVWFGTNRCPIDATNPSRGFSAERDSSVHHGLCEVTIPKSHRFGSVGSSWWKRFLTLTDDRLRLTKIAVFDVKEFWTSVKDALEKWEVGQHMALVFIHGFSVSFEEAAIRAAQIGFDLKIPGATAFFSWPSKGRLSLFDYTADEAAIEASEKQITDFLVGFAELSEAESVHVVAHSMGNRGLLRAMQRILGTAAHLSKKPFRQVIFAAPDVDIAVFGDLAKSHKTLAERATLYLSRHDRAIQSSGLIHDAPRAGFFPPVTIVEGIDTVEVSDVDMTLLGHGYYGAAEGVLYDMHELLIHNSPPKTRTRLKLAKTSVGEYWKIGA